MKGEEGSLEIASLDKVGWQYLDQKQRIRDQEIRDQNQRSERVSRCQGGLRQIFWNDLTPKGKKDTKN